MPIRWKITLSYSTILSLILFVIGLFLYLFYTQNVTAQFDRNLKQTGAEVIRSIKVEQHPFGFPFRPQIVLPNMDIFAASNTFLQAIDTNGRIIDRSVSLGSSKLPISKRILAEVAAGKSAYDTITLDRVKIRIYTTPIMDDSNQIYGILQIGGTLEQIERSLVALRMILLVAFSLAIFIVGAATWLLAKRMLRPLDELIRMTSEIEKGQDLKRRITYDGPTDEIGLLIEQSNHMFARLDHVYETLHDSYQMQKRFVSDASHELRTPLTSIKGNIDFLKKIYVDNPALTAEIVDELSSEVDRMTRLLNDLLSLARADAGYRMQMSAVDLQALIEEISPPYAKRNPAIDWRVEGLEESDAITIIGNRDYLIQLLHIVIENAFKYTGTGSVTLHLERLSSTTYAHERVRITISDTGIGIAENDLAHIFDRFFRAHNTASIAGTGLGLPIAEWIVEQHHGTITVTSELGIGTTVVIELPCTR